MGEGDCVVTRFAARLPAAQNRPDGRIDAMVFDALRVFEAENGRFGEPTIAHVAHWCDLTFLQAEKAIKRMRPRGVVVAAGRARSGKAQTYRAVVSGDA